MSSSADDPRSPDSPSPGSTSGDARYLDAEAAAKRLGISRSSLYSYVSRGQIRSEPLPGGGRRSRRYVAEDVDRLLERKRLRRDPDRAGERSLAWGTPVVESAICLIDRGRLFYRGRDAIALAETAGFEEVAALLWTGDADAAARLFPASGPGTPRAVPDPLDPLRALDAAVTAGALERCQAALPLAGAADPAAWDLRGAAMAATGARVLRLVADRLAGASAQRPGATTGRGVRGVARSEGIDGIDRIGARLARAWGITGVRGAERALSSTLILCADHELNVSAFTARCVASAEATLYDAVAAGLAALKGRRHGGITERVGALLREVATPAAARDTLAARLRRGEEIPGFGHPLYPEGDPRAAALLRLARGSAPEADRGATTAGRGADPDLDQGRRATDLVDAVVEAGEELLGERPTLDLGLVAVARALGLPDGAPLALFAAGRTAGWIAHAIEESERGRLIRPRARYVGPAPDEGTAD